MRNRVSAAYVSSSESANVVARYSTTLARSSPATRDGIMLPAAPRSSGGRGRSDRRTSSRRGSSRPRGPPPERRHERPEIDVCVAAEVCPAPGPRPSATPASSAPSLRLRAAPAGSRAAGESPQSCRPFASKTIWCSYASRTGNCERYTASRPARHRRRASARRARRARRAASQRSSSLRSGHRHVPRRSAASRDRRSSPLGVNESSRLPVAGRRSSSQSSANSRVRQLRRRRAMNERRQERMVVWRDREASR